MNAADRELLALAAKAAGIERSQWDYHWLRDLGHAVAPSMLWNPIDNSGQALELAVLLRFDIVTAGGCIYVGDQSRDGWYACEVVRNDPLAATRRAITVAAGRTLPA